MTALLSPDAWPEVTARTTLRPYGPTGAYLRFDAVAAATAWLIHRCPAAHVYDAGTTKFVTSGYVGRAIRWLTPADDGTEQVETKATPRPVGPGTWVMEIPHFDFIVDLKPASQATEVYDLQPIADMVDRFERVLRAAGGGTYHLGVLGPPRAYKPEPKDWPLYTRVLTDQDLERIRPSAIGPWLRFTLAAALVEDP